MNLSDFISQDREGLSRMSPEDLQHAVEETSRLFALGWEILKEFADNAENMKQASKEVNDLAIGVTLATVQSIHDMLPVLSKHALSQIGYLLLSTIHVVSYRAYQAGKREALADLVLRGEVGEDAR